MTAKQGRCDVKCTIGALRRPWCQDCPATLEDLPPDVQQAAKVNDNGEVEWPAASARDAIEALASAGAVILGLDLRDYDEDGRFVEIAWSSSEPTGGNDDPQRAKAAALAALDRPDVVGLGLASTSVRVA